MSQMYRKVQTFTSSFTSPTVMCGVMSTTHSLPLINCTATLTAMSCAARPLRDPEHSMLCRANRKAAKKLKESKSQSKGIKS